VSIFVDTSALYSLLDRREKDHDAAAEAVADLGKAPLVTHNYVVLESAALIQRRFGDEAQRALFDDLLPAIEVVWVDESVHLAAVAALLASRSRDISLVDWTSFEVMRRTGIEQAFAFDDDFAEQGFGVLPG
jgi:predicted nucleic acid-binding protein